MATKVPPRPSDRQDMRNRAREMAPRRSRDLGIVEVLQRHPSYTPETPVARPPGTVVDLTQRPYNASQIFEHLEGNPDFEAGRAAEAKRAQRMARFDETVSGITDDRTGRRQDERAGGRRKLDVSEETVERMSRERPKIDLAQEARERMERQGWWNPKRPGDRYRHGGNVLEPVFSRRDVTLNFSDPNYSRKLERLGYALESRETFVPLPKHQRTIGSAQQFDWFDKAEPFERYEITQEAARAAGVGRDYTEYAAAERAGSTPTPAQIEAYEKMRVMRDEMLAVDPRSSAEMRERGAQMRQTLDERAAHAREMRAMTTPGQPAVRSNLLSGAKAVRDTAGKWMGRLAWPLAAAGAITAVADEAEGAGLVNRANAAIRGGFGMDVLNANRVLGQRLGLFRPDDNQI